MADKTILVGDKVGDMPVHQDAAPGDQLVPPIADSISSNVIVNESTIVGLNTTDAFNTIKSEYYDKAQVDQKVNDLVGGAPGLLDTLGEISGAIANDPLFFNNVYAQVSGKMPKVLTAGGGNFSMFNGVGEVVDSGLKPTDFLLGTHDHAGDYIPIISSAVTGNFPAINAVGEITDSGFNYYTFAGAVHHHNDKYYTESEMNAGIMDIRYYTRTQLDGGQLDHRYYTETEMNLSMANKSDTSHTHDARYYQQAQITSLLAGKSDTSHTHGTFHTPDTDNYLLTNVGQTVYVDGSRTDTYTPNGNRTKPFNTLGAAITWVIAQGDNSVTKGYTILMAPGQYSESVSLNNSSLANLTIASTGERLKGTDTIINGTITCTSSNHNLRRLVFQGVRLATLTIQGESDNNSNYFDQYLVLSDCLIDNDVTVKNIHYGEMTGVLVQGNTILENIIQFRINRSIITDSLSVTYDATNNKPSGCVNTEVQLHQTEVVGPFTLLRGGTTGNVTLKAVSSLLSVNGSSCTVNTNCILQNYGTVISGVVSNTGTISIAEGGNFVNGIVGVGSISYLGNQSKYVSFVPTISGNWTTSPDNVAEALDELSVGVTQIISTIGGALTVVNGRITNVI